MDVRLFRWANRVADRSVWLHGPARWYASWGVALFAVLLLLAWWDARVSADPPRAVAAVAWAGVAPLVGALAVQVVGSMVDRQRPTAVIPRTHLLIARTRDFSFPSDHTTATAAVAVALLLATPLLRRRWYGWAAVALAVLMGLDRVYVGAHYFTDVAAGFALGAMVSLALGRPAVRALSVATNWVATTPLRRLVSGNPTPERALA